jgi:carboxypeptidase PM20D1
LVNNDSPESAVEYVKRCIHDDNVEVKVLGAQAATEYSSTEGKHWDLLAKAVSDTWEGCIVSPYLMIAGSDSRHYSGYCKDVYRFSAMHLSSAQRALVHNNDERIPVSEVAKTVEFFVRLEKSL